MTRERLEALPFESLAKIANQEGIDVPDDVERVLLVDLILEVLEEKKEEREARNNNPVRIQQKKYDLSLSEEIEDDNTPEDISIAERYFETRVVLMLRDPYWAFVYWDVKGGTLKAVKKENDADTVFLRILRLWEDYPRFADPKDALVDSFEIPVQSHAASWYINIPEQAAYYCVELCCRGKNSEKVIGRSNIVRVPRTVSLEKVLSDYCTPLDLILSLSGVEKLDVSAPARTIPQRISTFDEDRFPR